LLTPLEALKIIAAFRLFFPDRSLIVCGGRQVTLKSMSPLIFAAGADSLMTGDYLTTKGRLPEDDRQMLADLGLELEGPPVSANERQEIIKQSQESAVLRRK
jgi:biotin synthase